MKYAVLSDIHGNCFALRAALKDAARHGADQYLFLGDYYRSLPWPNETVDMIRDLPDAVVIRGNGEGYIPRLMGQDPNGWVYEQYKLNYWNLREFRRDNLDYLTALPETAVVENDGTLIHLHHVFKPVFRIPKVLPFHSSYFRNCMETRRFAHDDYLGFTKEALLARPDVLADLRALPDGVHLFGHNHLQWHAEIEGRLLVNPGSCGESCDHDARAAYTLLERVGDGWVIEERRVAYDVDAAVEGLRSSAFAAYAPVWAKVIELGVATGKDYFSPFLQHLHRTGKQMGRDSEPVANDVWAAAVEAWDPDRLYQYDEENILKGEPS